MEANLYLFARELFQDRPSIFNVYLFYSYILRIKVEEVMWTSLTCPISNRIAYTSAVLPVEDFFSAFFYQKNKIKKKLKRVKNVTLNNSEENTHTKKNLYYFAIFLVKNKGRIWKNIFCHCKHILNTPWELIPVLSLTNLFSKMLEPILQSRHWMSSIKKNLKAGFTEEDTLK